MVKSSLKAAHRLSTHTHTYNHNPWSRFLAKCQELGSTLHMLTFHSSFPSPYQESGWVWTTISQCPEPHKINLSFFSPSEYWHCDDYSQEPISLWPDNYQNNRSFSYVNRSLTDDRLRIRIPAYKNHSLLIPKPSLAYRLEKDGSRKCATASNIRMIDGKVPEEAYPLSLCSVHASVGIPHGFTMYPVERAVWSQKKVDFCGFLKSEIGVFVLIGQLCCLLLWKSCFCACLCT